MDIYAANILDHYKNPRNQGELPDPGVRIKVINPSCGDQMTVDFLIADGEVKDMKFQGNGCAISQAAISILSEEVIGRPLAEIDSIDKKAMFAMLGVPISERRSKCALMAVLALKNAVKKFRGQPEIGWLEVLA